MDKFTRYTTEKLTQLIENGGLGVMDADGIEEKDDSCRFRIETENGYYTIAVSPTFKG